MKRWAFVDPIYNVQVVVIRSTLFQLNRFLSREFGNEHTVPELSRSRAMCKWVSIERGCAVVLWFSPQFDARSPEWVSTIAHEVVHAVNDVFRDRGIPLVEAAEEPFAYYTGWLFQEVYVRLVTRGGKR